MALKLPRVCSKCGKEPKPKGGLIRMHLDPALCENCKPFPPPEEMVEVPKAEWQALARYVLEEEKVYRDSYNTPGKNNWESYFKRNHPEDYKVFKAARDAARRKF